MSIIDRLTVTPLLYACGGVLLSASIVLGVQTYRLHRAQIALASAKETLAAERAQAATDLLLFNAAARARELEHVERFAEAAKAFDEQMAEAQANADRTIADLRAGSIRLRDRWQACASSATVPSAPADPRGPDARADDRAESAGRIVRAAAECDAQVRGLQRLLMAERHDGGR